MLQVPETTKQARMIHETSMKELLDRLYAEGYRANLTGRPETGFFIAGILLLSTSYIEHVVDDDFYEDRQFAAAVECKKTNIKGVAIYR
jgi:hypothetical protein